MHLRTAECYFFIVHLMELRYGTQSPVRKQMNSYSGNIQHDELLLSAYCSPALLSHALASFFLLLEVFLPSA